MNRILVRVAMLALVCAGVVALTAGPAKAFTLTPNTEIVWFDKDGNGLFYPSPAASPIPLSYGVDVSPYPASAPPPPATLYYDLPFGRNQIIHFNFEDVAIHESVSEPDISDLVRLVSLGYSTSTRLYVYSELGGSSLADVGIPENIQVSMDVAKITAPTGNRVAMWYADLESKPGYDYEHGLPVFYYFITDYAVPEPSTLIVWTLLGAFGIAIGWRRRRAA